jgi:hypothetical protein
MRYEYPYKLGKPSYASKNIRETAETYIMDSGIGEDITNEEVLDMAAKVDADLVVAKDILHDQEQTTQNVKDFLCEWEDHHCRATPMIPLQPHHDEHFFDLSEGFHYLLGGISPSLTDYTTQDVIDFVERFRESVGMGPYVHLLGVGANPKLAEWLGKNPEMVDSIDCSTPEQCAINGNAYDLSLRQKDYQMLNGNGSSRGRRMLAKHLAFVLNDAIVRSYRGVSKQDDQQSLEAFC